MGTRGDDRRISNVEVIDVEKRRIPSKHYVYIINVTWSDGLTNVIYRRYSRFFDFQHVLLGKFPSESGQLDPNSRVIPFLPGKIYFGRSHIRDVALKRLQPIEEYCKTLLNLPDHISQSEDVRDFFDVEPDDLNPATEDEKKKKSANINKISGPKLAEQYRVIADYKKEDKWDLNLKAGTEVEVLEKSESGWWFVSVEDQQGWVPSTYLKRKDGASEIMSQRAKPGEEESYISTENYEPAGSDEVRLDKGAVVDVLEKKLDGWWYVRYKGVEGWAPATYLMKAEKEHMQRVARASGVEIVGGLSDISTLLKGEDAQADTTAAPPRPNLPKAFKKARSLERGGSIRPPPRQNSIKNINLDALKPSVSREDKYYITKAEFHDSVGDGISFTEGEIVHVKEKSDGGWWFVKIGDKEGWAPSTYLAKADPDDVSEDYQELTEDPEYAAVAEESDDDANRNYDDNEWDDDDDDDDDDNVYEVVDYEVPKISIKESSNKHTSDTKNAFTPNAGIKSALRFKHDNSGSRPSSTVQQVQTRDKSPRRLAGGTGVQRPSSKPPPPPVGDSADVKGTTDKLKNLNMNKNSVASALNNQLQAKLSSDSSRSSTDGERSETGRTKPLLPTKPSISDGQNKSPRDPDRKSKLDFVRKSPSNSGNTSPRGPKNSQDSSSGNLADILKSKFEKRQTSSAEPSDNLKPEGQFHTYPKKPMIPPSKMKSESKGNDSDKTTDSYKSLPLPKTSDRPVTPPKTVKSSIKSSNNLQVGNKELSPKRHSMQEEGSDLASVLKAKFELRRQSADVSSINYSSIGKQKKTGGQKPLLPPKSDIKQTARNSGVSVSGKPLCSPKPEIDSNDSKGKTSGTQGVAAAMKSKFEGVGQPVKPKPAFTKPTKPTKPYVASSPVNDKSKSSVATKSTKTEDESSVKPGFAKALASKLSGNTPGSEKPSIAPKVKINTSGPQSSSSSDNSQNSWSEESQSRVSFSSTTKPGQKQYRTLANYTGAGDGEISFLQGALVEIIDKSDGWWLVKINQEEGWAPATYIGQVETDTSTSDRSASPVIDSGFTSPEEGSNSVSSQKYRTTAEFRGESDSELGFKSGVFVEVLDCSDDDWWYVRIDGNEGWVPADYLEEV